MVYFDFIAQKSQGTYPAKKEICDLLSYLLLTFTERTIHSPFSHLLMSWADKVAVIRPEKLRSILCGRLSEGLKLNSYDRSN